MDAKGVAKMTKFTMCEHVVLERDEDTRQTILIDNQSGVLCTCNETASVLLESLKSNCTLQELVTALTNEFEVDSQQASEDVTRLLDSLNIFGFIKSG